jgi:hypothetical protein
MGERFRSFNYESYDPEPTPDLDRLKERLEAEKFDPRTSIVRLPHGRMSEIQNYEYPEWYEQGKKLLEILDGRRMSDEELRELAEELGFDLDEILGRIKEDESKYEDGAASSRIERGKG